jgi:hypothetical protein
MPPEYDGHSERRSSDSMWGQDGNTSDSEGPLFTTTLKTMAEMDGRHTILNCLDLKARAPLPYASWYVDRMAS